jgi:hypothetical protein
MVFVSINEIFRLWFREIKNLSLTMDSKNKSLLNLYEKDLKYNLTEYYNEDELLKMNLKLLTENELESVLLNETENYKECIDAIQTKIDSEKIEDKKELINPEGKCIDMKDKEQES